MLQIIKDKIKERFNEKIEYVKLMAGMLVVAFCYGIYWKNPDLLVNVLRVFNEFLRVLVE